MKVRFLVSFGYNWSLEHLKKKRYTLKRHFDYEDWSKKFEKYWRKYEGEILNTIKKKTKIKWKDKEVWCYLTPTVLGYSHPLTVKISKNMSITMKILIHELIHINFGDYFYKIKKMMPKNVDKLNYMAHVPLYLVYMDVIKQISPKDKKMFLEHELERQDYRKAVIKARKLYPEWKKWNKDILSFVKKCLEKELF